MKIYSWNLLWFVLFMLKCGVNIPDNSGWASLNGGTVGGMGGDTIFVDNRSQLLDAISISGSAIISIRDTIYLLDGEQLEVTASNISIIGSDRNAMIRNGGLMIIGNNVIIQNLSIGDSYIDGHWDGKGEPNTDCLTLYGRNILVDHCELYKSYDGLVDIVHKGMEPADYITVSWTKFSNHNKAILVGSNDEDTLCRGHLNLTIHHCWFDGYSKFYDAVDGKYYNLNQRLPRVRFGKVHVFNNYYEGVGAYCIAARFESDVLVENNYFRNLGNPHIIEDIGLGLKDPELTASGNIYNNTSGRHETKGCAFDPLDHYKYSLDPTSIIPALVMNGAGKFNPGNNRSPVASDDTVYLRNGRKIMISPLDNDYDPDGDVIRISAVLNQPYGKTVLDPFNIVYTHPYEMMNYDTITYQIVDFDGGTDTASIVIYMYGNENREPYR